MYFNSLVNLGCFVTGEERADHEDEIEDTEFAFDDVELSQLGRSLAESYDSLVGRLSSSFALFGPLLLFLKMRPPRHNVGPSSTTPTGTEAALWNLPKLSWYC